MSDLAIKIRQNFAFLTAVVSVCVVYFLYNLAHPKGFSSAVFVQNSDEVFTLALVSMAQTVPGSRRRPRPFGRRADDDGRLLRELSLERRARRHASRARLRRMAGLRSGRCREA